MNWIINIISKKCVFLFFMVYLINDLEKNKLYISKLEGEL